MTTFPSVLSQQYVVEPTPVCGVEPQSLPLIARPGAASGVRRSESAPVVPVGLTNDPRLNRHGQTERQRGLRRSTRMRVLRFVISIAVLGLLPGGEILAGSVSAPMHVSATVIARAILSVDSAPETIEVTTSDIARGYFDIAAPLVVRVRTNSRAGYLLRVDAVTADFQKVELSFGDAQMTVSGPETWMSRPYVPGGEVLSMRMRVHLRENARAGSYPLPVALSTEPL